MPPQTQGGDVYSMHRHVSVEFIRNSGGLAVQVQKGEKKPEFWEPNANDSGKSEKILREALQDYSFNLGLHLGPSLVDIDIDSDSPAFIAALDLLLPTCSHVWGRGSRKRTHRVYKLTLPFDIAKYPEINRLKRIESFTFELRAGNVYSVVPGSVHPSGDYYEWDDINAARNSVALTTMEKIITAVRLAGAVDVLIPYWTEGQRNNLMMPLAGFLAYTSLASKTLTDGNSECFILTKPLAERFLSTLLKVAGDDDRTRWITLQKTWEKAEDEKGVTGGKTLAQLTSGALLNNLRLLLNDSPNAALLDRYLEQYAIWQGPGVVIDMEAAAHGETKFFMTRQQFCNSNGNDFIEFADGKQKLVADLLFHSPLTTRLRGVTFAPGSDRFVKEDGGEKFNQWRGFAVDPWPTPVNEEDVHPFIDYIFKLISSSKQDRYEWVMAWMANIFQEPANRTGTALVLVGLPGVGKTFLGQYFLLPLVGHHGTTTSSIERAVSGFNAHFDNRLLVQCDEALSNRQRQTAAKLKALITDPYLTIEPKGIDPYNKPNHMRFLFTSNEIKDAIFISDGMDDRRYTVYDVSPERQGQIEEYWEGLATWAKNKENLAKVHRYLRDYQYKRSLISKPLFTPAKVAMQEHSMPAFDKWLLHWVSRGHPISESAHQHWYDAPNGQAREINRWDWPKWVRYTALEEDYATLIRRDGAPKGTVLLTAQQIKNELRDRGFGVVEMAPMRIRVEEFDGKLQSKVDHRIRLYRVPTKKQIEEYLKEKYGIIPDAHQEENDKEFKIKDKEETEF